MRLFIVLLLIILSSSPIKAQIKKQDTLSINGFDSLEFISITYTSDSFEVEGFIVSPKYGTNLPIVIFNRGGNRNYYNVTEQTLKDWIAHIAKNGYIVFASQYRAKDEFGGDEINDIIELLQLAKNYPNVDSSKIGMVGWSRGGLMTYLALKQTSEIDCAIIGGAPSDMYRLIAERPNMENVLRACCKNYDSEKDSCLYNRSPVLWADELNKTSLLLIHGKDDSKVEYNHSLVMSEQLHKIDYQHELIIFENDDHILRKNREKKDVLIANWLNTHLKP